VRKFSAGFEIVGSTTPVSPMMNKVKQSINIDLNNSIGDKSPGTKKKRGAKVIVVDETYKVAPK
jgi:hypothetical protein